MKRCHRIIICSFAATIVLLSTSQIFAQWDSVFTCHSGGNPNTVARPAFCGYFFNEFTGLVASTGDAGIFRTTDGGKSWIRTNTPLGYFGNFTQIVMQDLLNGWAVIEEPIHGNGYSQSIFKTTDGGLNWTPIGPTGYFTCIAQTPSALVVTSRRLGGPTGVISTDGGATFTAGQLRGTNAVDFVDNFHGVATGFEDSSWQRTVDGGRTWTIIPPVTAPIDTECWGIYAVKGTPVFYTAPETDARNQAPGDHSNVYRSVDFGATWSLVSQLKFFTTGNIAGFNESVLYVQAENDNSVNPNINSGFYRSTDRGATWVPIGGPKHANDTRFVVTGCNGGVVYAFDKNGVVWKTRNGGDGAIIEPPVTPRIQGNPIVFSGPICSESNAALEMENLYCGNDSIVSAQLVDTTSAIISSGALSITYRPAFPLLLLPHTKDSLLFIWQPSKIFHSDTTVTIQVKVRYYSNVLGQTFDTIVTISVHAIGEPPLADVLPNNLNFQTVSFCSPHDTTFILRNNGCDTLHVLNGNPNAKIHYQILDSNASPLIFPLALAPSDSQKITIRLALDSAGSYSSNLVLRLFHQGIEKDTTINIAAILSAKGSYVMPDSIDFGAISTCRTLDSLTIIKNLGCLLPIKITNATLKYNTVFSLVGVPPYTPTIPPNSIGSVNLQFVPTAAQEYVDTLTISFYALGEQQTKNVVLKGKGFAVPAILVTTISRDTLFNLKLTRCDRDTIFTISLSNPGCDSIILDSARLEGIGTPNISLSVGSALPLVVNARNNKSLNLQVTVSPKIIGTYSGALHVVYEIGNQKYDTLMPYSLTVNYGPRILSNDHDTIDLGTMKLCDSRDSAINLKDIGCDTVQIVSETIQGNGNFVLTSSPVSFLSENQPPNRISFHFNPIGAGDITGVLTVTTISDSIPVRKIYLIAHVIPTDTTKFTMLPTRNTFYAGDTLSVRLIPQQDIHGRGLYSIAFTLTYNGDLVTLLDPGIGAQTTYGSINQLPVGGTPKQTTERITLLGNPSLELDKDSPAITFRFFVTLTDSITTTFDLSDIQLNGGDSIYAKCQFGILSASLVYQLGYKCGDSMLVKYMQLGKNLNIFTDAVYPNPLTERNNYQGVVPFHTSEAGEFSVAVYDGMGRKVLTDNMQVQNAGAYSFAIDGRNLSSGCYSYILQDNSGTSVRGRFIIAK
jgi:photosystem II stability/assembly factor-like uncharacterized protein